MSKTWVCVTVWPSLHWSPLLGFTFVTGLKSNLRTPLTTRNSTEHNCIISHAQNTSSLQANAFLTGLYQLMVTNKARSAFPSTNHYQGQMQTPQSVSVLQWRTILSCRYVRRNWCCLISLSIRSATVSSSSQLLSIRYRLNNHKQCNWQLGGMFRARMLTRVRAMLMCMSEKICEISVTLYIVRITVKETRWPYHTPGSQRPASHCGDPGSLPGQFTFVFFPCAPVIYIVISFHQYSILTL
jgi:hypothetical protein